MSIYLPDGNSPLKDYEIFADVDFIVTDLDGTLIDGGDPVLGQIKRLIAKLKRQHTQITVATGRTYNGAETRINELGVDIGMPVALYNGGMVVEHGTGNILYASYVPGKVVYDLMNIIHLERTKIYVYTFSTFSPFVFENKEGDIRENVYAWGMNLNERDVNGMIIQHIQLERISKMKISAVLIDNLLLDSAEKQKILELLQQYSEIKITDSGSGFIEIKGGGMNKGIIYNVLKNHERFSGKKILAIGDNDNDIELFRGADISVAVANSSTLALENADYVCDSESAQGFCEMLQVLERAKRYY